MFLFHILVLPAILIVPCYLKKSFKDYVVPVIFGVIFAVLWALFDSFFVFSATYFEYSILKIFLTILIKNTLVPLVLTGLVFFILIKGSIDSRFKSFFPLWTAFFSIALPYSIKSGKTSFSFFELFIIPLLFACLLILLDIFIRFIISEVSELKSKSGADKNNSVRNLVIYGLLILASLCFFSLSNTLWFVGFGWLFWFLSSAAFVFFTVMAIIRTKYFKIF